MSCRSRRSSAGFSVLEVLVATTLIAIAAGSIANLLVMATAANRRARDATLASTLAAQKIEQLRSYPFAYGAAGDPIDDPRLAESPPGSLEHDEEGYTDRPEGTPFVRRWGVRLLADAPDAVVLNVVVLKANATTPVARLTSVRHRVAP